MGLVAGTNNFAELQTLKLLLCWLIPLGLSLVQIFGDSQNVIKWFNEKYRFQNYMLNPLLEEVLNLKQHFNSISVCHIYRERNTVANLLSKEGLQQAVDGWSIRETDQDVIRVSNQPPFVL